MTTDCEPQSCGLLNTKLDHRKVGKVGWLAVYLPARQHRTANLCQLRLRETGSISRLRMANEIECILPYAIHDNNVKHFTVKHSSHINATTGYLIE